VHTDSGKSWNLNWNFPGLESHGISRPNDCPIFEFWPMYAFPAFIILYSIIVLTLACRLTWYDVSQLCCHQMQSKYIDWLIEKILVKVTASYVAQSFILQMALTLMDINGPWKSWKTTLGKHWLYSYGEHTNDHWINTGTAFYALWQVPHAKYGTHWKCMANIMG